MNSIRKQQIIDSLEKLKKNPLSLQELLMDERNEARRVQRFLKSNEPLVLQSRAKSDSGEPQHIILYTTEELAFSLAYLNLSKEEQKSILLHETSHFKMACDRGLLARFVGIIYKNSQGKIGCNFATQINLNADSTPNEQQRKFLREVISAPKRLSAQDKQMLQ